MTSLTNREVFARDPLKNRLPNDGVTKIGEPATREEWDVLRYELSTFVCDGEYRRGLETILDTYLKNVGRATQPAVWVSGFYGSGKSHLVRMLEFLWRDVRFPDGATARSVAQLPELRARHAARAGHRRATGPWAPAPATVCGSPSSASSSRPPGCPPATHRVGSCSGCGRAASTRG